ncbi:MAG: hypothetical protein NC412_01015 [Roseburia sp.]|nr:hypothetical protein [Roseburia sp.]MCM1277913.1 hypothetical protein [Robinsoniella sp.]
MNFNSETFIFLIIIINTLIAVLYMAVMGIKTRLPYVFQRGMVMILCPVTGLFCYFFSFLLGLLFRNKEVDYENLSMDKTKKEFLENVDREREMEVLPLEEVLTVSVAKDRRRAMLNMLKMDVSEKLNLVRKAVENEDSETSHYAAAALTDIFNKFTLQLNELQVKYDDDRSNQQTNVEFLDAVLRILNSGGLIGVEEAKYDYMYINLLENLEKFHPDAITESYYAMMVRALEKVGRTKDAEDWAERSLQRQPDSEQSYLNVMYIKYVLGKEEEFDEVLRKLTKSSVSLSQKGLDIVRFWLAK